MVWGFIFCCRKPEKGGGGGGGAPSSAASFLFGRAQSDVLPKTAASVTPAEYPLYCLSNRDRPKFAVGVFLLNKNVIQLLQAHGISAAGPSQLLQNLHKLVAAAQSAQPPGVGGGYWRW